MTLCRGLSGSALVVAATLGGWQPAGRIVEAAPAIPPVAWSPCYREFGAPFECGTVQVPLDHDNPAGASVSIALVRLPAGDPAARIGSLFLNPGGPGGSGVDFVLFLGPFLYTSEVRARFDLVGFDPRGISRSTALRCFGTTRQWSGAIAGFPFPTNPEEEQSWEAADGYLVSNCDQRGTRLLDHMATADVARDLDLLRQAVRDDKLTYAGYSYGSYLGVTYANLFPNRFRAVVVDGVLDPIAWSTGMPGEQLLPFSTRLRSDAGARATLEEFFRLCDEGGTACAFSGGAAARFAALADSLKASPIPLPLDPNRTFLFTYADLVANTLGAMYDSFSWPSFADFLAALESEASVSAGVTLTTFWRERGYITKRGFPRYPNFLEGFPGVACSDSDNPDSYQDWSVAATAAEAQFGYFGPLWTWVSSICARWPGRDDDRYVGPFTTSTGAPVLVVGNHYDPATRYEGALAVNALLPNSSLLTVHAWGHASLFLSVCADLIVAEYLIDGTTPTPGTVCAQDGVPFGGSPLVGGSSPQRSELRREFVIRLVPDVILASVR
jgi:pimeloyl-ACP methyl ester carboxylesterase